MTMNTPASLTFIAAELPTGESALWAPPDAPIDMPRQVLEPARRGWSLRRLWPVRDVNA
ncbi:hypothetical protein ACXN5S_14410 [Pseudoroseicyclus sp. H15]